MTRTETSLRRFAAASVLMLSGALILDAQRPSTERKTAEETNKNIKVLRGTPADSFNR